MSASLIFEKLFSRSIFHDEIACFLSLLVKHNWSLLLLQRIFHKFHKQLPCSIRKGVVRNFAKFTGKRLCQRLFFNNVADLNPATLLKKRLWHRCFTVNFAKFLRAPLL